MSVSLAWLRDGLGWRYEMARRYAFLLLRFRNGRELLVAYRTRSACERAISWDGTVWRHPRNRGLVETILEVWQSGVYTRGFYTPAPGDVVLDAGSNVGLFAVWMARRFPHVRVFALEPFEENFKLLEENIASAAVANVTPLQAALSGHSGKGSITRVGDRSLDHRLVTGATECRAEIPIYSLAAAIQLTGALEIALFKIDVEGSEYEAFLHARTSDLARVARFAIEYHEHHHSTVLQLLMARLQSTHRVRIEPAGTNSSWGMVYATRKQTARP